MKNHDLYENPKIGRPVDLNALLADICMMEYSAKMEKITSTITHLLLTTLALLAGSGCGTKPETPHTTWQEIQGRDPQEGDQKTTRDLLYRVRVPAEWVRRDPAPQDSNADTTKPNCEFLIGEGKEAVRVTIHTFPSKTIERRIPPSAQIARWQNQFSSLNTSQTVVEPEARGGFFGLFFEGHGKMQKKESSEQNTTTAVLGWAMQLDFEHYETLTHMAGTPKKQELYEQMRADYTIKATGSEGAIAKHKKEITAFAKSFELINEVPQR